MPALLLGLWAGGAGRDRYARTVAAGLLVSALADLAIEASFVAGLGTFLVAHLLYVTAFWSETPALRPVLAIPFLAFGLGVFSFLSPGLGAMGGPVGLYVAAIAAMMWRAAARVGASERGRASAWAGLVGALLFGSSDTLIGLDRFHAPIPGVRYPIILLYWAGQVGIALSTQPAAASRGQAGGASFR